MGSLDRVTRSLDLFRSLDVTPIDIFGTLDGTENPFVPEGFFEAFNDGVGNSGIVAFDDGAGESGNIEVVEGG